MTVRAILGRSPFDRLRVNVTVRASNYSKRIECCCSVIASDQRERGNLDSLTWITVSSSLCSSQ
jgi:hypothetical protein